MFQQKRNRKFNIPKRFSDENANNESRDFQERWNEARATNTKRKKGLPLGILFAVLIALIVAMYIIDKKYL